MDKQLILNIFLAGFLFTFFIQIFWGRLVDKFGAFGGVLSGTLISGSIWILSHGLSNHLIYQSGSIWIDMAWAPAIGGITFSLLNGHNLKKSFPNFLAAISGGIFAGMVICILQ